MHCILPDIWAFWCPLAARTLNLFVTTHAYRKLTLLCDVQSLSVNQEYEITVDELLMRTSDRVFEFLGGERQRRLRLFIREHFFKRIRDHWRQRQRLIALDGSTLRIRWELADEKEVFLNWLEDRRVKFDASRPEPRRMPLLDDLPEPTAEED